MKLDCPYDYCECNHYEDGYCTLKYPYKECMPYAHFVKALDIYYIPCNHGETTTIKIYEEMMKKEE